MTKDLTLLVKELIETRREGDWWDFKQEHHHNNAELVHDITCMANSQANRDSFIIFGVEDKNYSIKGIEGEKPRRQQHIVDILRGVQYAGGVRPSIELRTIALGGHVIDVLIIKNTKDVPYYLEKEYKDSSPDGKRRVVRPFHIYTRVGDTNTPIDASADINVVELLWRKRFGLDLSPQDRVMHLLNDFDKWDVDFGNRKYAFHADFPEYRLVRGEVQDGWHPAAAFYANPKMHFAPLRIMYNDTIIVETELWFFDEFRKELPKAKNWLIQEKGMFGYSFYLKNTIEGKLLSLFTKGTFDLSSRVKDFHQILVFEDEKEKGLFDQYLASHFNDYPDDEIQKQYQFQIQEDSYTNGGGKGFSAFHVAKCAKLYEDWKSHMIAEMENNLQDNRDVPVGE